LSKEKGKELTIWNQCLIRATQFPSDSSHYGHDTIATAQAAEAELDHVYSVIVPELCTRLMKACQHLELSLDFLPTLDQEEVDLEREFIEDLKKPL